MIRDNRPGGGDRTREQGFPGDRLTDDEARETAREIAQEARHKVDEVTRKISESGRELAAEQKNRIARVFNDISAALREAGDTLQRHGDEVLASYCRTLAKQCDRVCRYVEDRSPNEILQDVRSLVSRRPEIFIGAMFLAGLGASRFFKASKHSHSGGGGSAGTSSVSGYQTSVSESQQARYGTSATTSTAGAAAVQESAEQMGAGESQIRTEPGGQAVEATSGPISEAGVEMEGGMLPASHFAEPRETDIPEAMRREAMDLDIDVDVGERGVESRSPDRPDYSEEI